MKFWKKPLFALEPKSSAGNNNEMVEEIEKNKRRLKLATVDSPELNGEIVQIISAPLCHRRTSHSLCDNGTCCSVGLPISCYKLDDRTSSPSIVTSTRSSNTKLPNKVGLCINVASYGYEDNNPNERQLQDYYAKTFTKVTDYLYLSGEKGAHNGKMLEEFQITHIINCAGYHSQNLFSSNISTNAGGSQRVRSSSSPIEYLTLYLHDHLDESIQRHFTEIIEFIENLRKAQPNAKILIHCKMGISRGPSMVIAYLMWLNIMTYEEALRTLQKLRPVVGPNIGFVTELMEWEKTMHHQIKKQK